MDVDGHLLRVSWKLRCGVPQECVLLVSKSVFWKSETNLRGSEAMLAALVIENTISLHNKGHRLSKRMGLHDQSYLNQNVTMLGVVVHACNSRGSGD